MASIKNIDGLYDIGLVASINYNYGNNLTNYALYMHLMKNELSVLLIDSPSKNNWLSINSTLDNLSGANSFSCHSPSISFP